MISPNFMSRFRHPSENIWQKWKFHGFHFLHLLSDTFGRVTILFDICQDLESAFYSNPSLRKHLTKVNVSLSSPTQILWCGWLSSLPTRTHLHHHRPCRFCLQVFSWYHTYMAVSCENNVNAMMMLLTKMDWLKNNFQCLSANGVHIRNFGRGQQILRHSTQISNFTGEKKTFHL